MAAINAMMAEVDRTQAIDPAAREKLLQDLRQTEPKLRPLVMQQFRAAVAYRRQVEQREAAAVARRTPSPGSGDARPAFDTGSTDMPFPRPQQAPGPAEAGRREAPPSPTQQGQTTGREAARGSAGNEMGLLSGGPGREFLELGYSNAMDRPVFPLPSPAPNPRVQPDRPPPAERPGAADQRERTECQEGRPLPGSAVKEPSNCVQTAAHLPVQKASADWQSHLAAAIRAKESSLPPTPQSADDIAEHARLRMLYLLAGRRDDALRPIPAAAASLRDLQDFWLHEIYGLVVWLDAQRITDPRRRAHEASRHLETALARLADMSPLVVRNLTFVTEVQSFGNYKRCKSAEFAAEEAVLLYAEVDNLKSEETPKGFHTAWRSSYRIFDHRDQMVVDHEPMASEEHCQNLRRDFFIACQFRLPKRIYPGKHSLQLTVEDLKSQKVGQSSIEFTVKPGKE